MINVIQSKENALKFVIGMNPDVEIYMPSNTFEINPELASLDTSSIENRTEIKLLNAQRALQTFSKKSIQAHYYPTLSLQANYGYAGFGQKFPLINNNAVWANFASIGLNLSFPIFTGFATRSKSSGISGTINDVKSKPGTYVSPGTEMFSLVNVGTLKLRVNVDEKNVVKLKVGQNIKITASVYPEQIFRRKDSLSIAPKQMEVLNFPGRDRQSKTNPNNELRAVQTVYPGASPSEVENTVSKKIEDAISSLENVKRVETKSYESLSLVMITLNDNADANYALNDAQRKINAILKDLPDDVDPPSLVKFSLDDMPIKMNHFREPGVINVILLLHSFTGMPAVVHGIAIHWSLHCYIYRYLSDGLYAQPDESSGTQSSCCGQPCPSPSDPDDYYCKWYIGIGADRNSYSREGSDMNRGLAIVIIGDYFPPYSDMSSCRVYSIFDSIQKRFGKHAKLDYEALMKADYEPNKDYVDEMSVKH
ncbi:hypothetical protein FQR65_LT18546 [Abscondita terminalis]|nr:hypothetical protein FQR65_LT18546 [Abscondita terminalis]